MRGFRAGLLGILLAGALTVPYASASQLDILLAQVAALKSQITSLQQKSSAQAGVRVCFAPDRTLKRGDSGDDVANLQIFLARDAAVYPEGLVMGEYGPATERAVQRWQTKYGIASSGTPSSTGFGSVGARTLALMKQLWQCGGTASAGWFNTNVTGGVVTFSAQASSDVPLDQSLYIETGDGAKVPLTISTAVCKTLGGQCSSVLSAQHTYAGGTFTATLRRAQTTQQCLIFSQLCVDGIGICGSLPPSCSSNTTIQVLATTTLVSSGAPASSLVSASNAGFVSQTAPPAIRVLSPGQGASVLSGGSLTVGWSTTNPPTGATVSVVLKSASGSVVGTIATGQHTSGTYWWQLPLPSGSTCTADPLTCLTQLASPSCSGDVCSLPNGTYTVSVRLISGAVLVTSAESPAFSVTSTQRAVTIATGTSTSARATAASGATSSAGVLGALPSGSSPSAGASCVYSGIPYGNNITLQVSCTDLAGIGCGNFGMTNLTCRNGTWVDSTTGAVASVPNITTSAATGGSCTTPWGSQKVQSGNQITYEPFFTGGQYTGTAVMPLMQCTSGSWQKCQWDGTNCQAYTVVL